MSDLHQDDSQADKTNQINEKPPEISQPISQPIRRWLSRRNVIVAAGLPILLIVFLVIIVILAVRLGYVGEYIQTNLVAQLDKIGLKTEIGKLETNFSPLGVILRDVKLYDKETNEQLAKIDLLKLDATVVDLFALNFEREVRLDSTEIEGLEAFVKFDEQGRLNFSRLKIPESEESNLTFNYSAMKLSVKNSIINYGDFARKLSGEARNVQLFVEPDAGLSQSDADIENRRFKFDLAATNSTFTFDQDKQIEPLDVSARGVITETYAEIAELRLKTPFAESRLSGKLDNFENPRYKFDIESSVDLQRTAEILKTDAALRGFGNLNGTVEGEGGKYIINANIKSDALAADNVRLKGLQANASVSGENDAYEINGKAIADMLNAGDFQLDTMSLVGKVTGTGTDFRWIGDLQAAAAKFPDGTIAGLIIKDAVGEYRDERFSTNVGSLSAENLNGFGTKFQQIRAARARVVYKDGTTDVTAGNLRVGGLQTKAATLRGININNAKVRNRGNVTDIQAGNLTAQTLDSSVAKVNGVSISGANVKVRGNNVDAKAGNLKANDVQTDLAKVRGVNANGVKVETRGNRVTVNSDNLTAQNVDTNNAKLRGVTVNGAIVETENGKTVVNADNVTAQNLDASSANVNDLRASGVDVTDSGETTSVNASSVQIGGLNTPQVVVGSLNVAGVRLKIVRGVISGSTNDINAGDVALKKTRDLPQGGTLENVKLSRPVFVVESASRYRVTSDLSLGGGILGSIKVGAASASVTASESQVDLKNLNANIFDGNVNGEASVNLNNRGASSVAATFNNLDVAKLLALTGGRIVPLSGNTSGDVNLSFDGTNFKTASGTLNANVNAEAGDDQRGRVPVTGTIGLRATRGLFDIETANFKTANSDFNANGRFDLEGDNSNLGFAVNSTDARELQRLISVLGVSDSLDAQLAQYKIGLAGTLKVDGTLTGNLQNPNVRASANLESVTVNNENIGALTSNIELNQNEIVVTNGTLQQPNNNGNIAFDVRVPRADTNNVAVKATLDNLNAGTILAALPIEGLPDFVRSIQAKTSGTIDLTGVPNNIKGIIDLNAANGSIGGESFDSFATRINFQGTLATIEKLEARSGDGSLSATGNYNGDTDVFNVNAIGRNIPASKIKAFAGDSAKNLPEIGGIIDLTANGTGELAEITTSDFSKLNVNFNGAARDVAINNTRYGNIIFTGNTQNQKLNANVTADINGTKQVVAANLNFGDKNLPFEAQTVFDNTDLAPFAALLQQTGSTMLGGRATGIANIKGNLVTIDPTGKRQFSTDNLRGEARFSTLTLQVEDTILSAAEPVDVKFTMSEVVVNSARFTGSGTNLVVAGKAVLSGSGENTLTANGSVNLRILNAFVSDQFFGGVADISARFSGNAQNPNIVGSIGLNNVSFSTFVSSERLSVTSIRGRILFNTNQVQIETLEGKIGGGTINVSGGAALKNLQLQGFRLAARGNGISTTLTQGIRVAGDVDLSFGGVRDGNGVMSSKLSGSVIATRASYTQDIDLANLLNNRRGGVSLSSGGNSGGANTPNAVIGVPQLEIRVEGRDALIIRNNVADLVGSISARVAGDVNEPVISGRITANSGTLTLLRDQRYDIQRGSIDIPEDPNASPIVNLQAEGDVSGYQVFLGVSGPIYETESLAVNVRSNPALPQADVISLITTGSLADTEGGIPSLAQTGLNTAAGALTDAVVAAPIRRATDRLFGLNRFELDPSLAGQRGLNPSARLTVGRQINRNLSVTYATNLSADRNQVIALEYRVSNRISFVAQFQQAPLNNITRRNSNFNFEVRFRKRF
ncbi:MAG: translocation/assembly module TamB domain-containing protein [Pyrinomonadaceae bacterium]|nr:translocation/assembly module TamB domain-containing protein [Pyrinomonadaceae bacterium]